MITSAIRLSGLSYRMRGVFSKNVEGIDLIMIFLAVVVSLIESILGLFFSPQGVGTNKTVIDTLAWMFPVVCFPISLLTLLSIRVASVALWIVFAGTYISWYLNFLPGTAGGRLSFLVAILSTFFGPPVIGALITAILLQLASRTRPDFDSAEDA